MRAFLSFAMILASPASLAASVHITIHGVPSNRGTVRVTLCPRDMFLQPLCPWRASMQALAGDVQLTIENVPPGLYAAQAFHDENGNGHLDKNFLGVPKESIGFSNDAPMRFGPPDFNIAAFKVGTGPADIVFSLKKP